MKSEKKVDIDKILGEIFKEYRIKNKLTQEKIAEKLGISVKYISRIENGTGGVKVETLVNYMNILGIAPNVVFKDLMTNKNVTFQVNLSQKISELSDDRQHFIDKIVDDLKVL